MRIYKKTNASRQKKLLFPKIKTAHY